MKFIRKAINTTQSAFQKAARKINDKIDKIVVLPDDLLNLKDPFKKKKPSEDRTKRFVTNSIEGITIDNTDAKGRDLLKDWQDKKAGPKK